MITQDQDRLKRVQRDIRTAHTEGFRQFVPESLHSAAFAQSILARYGGATPGRVGMLERIYRRLAFGVFLQRIYRQTLPASGRKTNLSLTLNFLYPSGSHEPDRSQIAESLSLSVPGDLSLTEQLRHILTRRIHYENRVEALAQQVVMRTHRTEERISTSKRRVEAGAEVSSGTTTGETRVHPVTGDVLPLPSLNREYAHGPVANANTPQASPSMWDESPTGVTARRVPPANSPSVDMNELTEQVIRAIDQRIIAQRERLGRN